MLFQRLVRLCVTPRSQLKLKNQVAGGEASQDGEAAGGGQVEDGRGAKKVFDAPRNQS